MPYYDVVAYWTYAVTNWLVGLRAVSVFNLFVSISALPLFYLGVRNLFNRQVALYSLVFFAFYPKLLVMTAEALPEVASTSFAAMSLYPLSKAVDNGSVGIAAIGGATATLAFLMFDPAVAFLGLTIMFLYAARAKSPIDRTAIDRTLLGYAVPSTLTGVLYVVLGPFRSAFDVGTGGDAGFGTGARELFVHPESLSILDKSSRFLAYTYFDFWWHVRGFDTEGMILTLLRNMAEFMEPLFPVFIGGWVTVTLILTITIVVGTVKAVSRHRMHDAFVVIWFAGYGVLFLGTNLGWQGAFQTRHVFPIFPSIAILFGIGIVQLLPYTAGWVRSPLQNYLDTSRGGQSDLKTIIPVATVTLVFLILVTTAIAQVALLADNNAVRHQEPIERLDAVADNGDHTAMIIRADRDGGVGSTYYREAVFYSEGRLNPAIYSVNKGDGERFEKQTVAADVRVGSPAETLSAHNETTYLFLKSTCGTFAEGQTAFRKVAMEQGGIIVWEDRTVTGQSSACEVNVLIIRLNSTQK